MAIHPERGGGKKGSASASKGDGAGICRFPSEGGERKTLLTRPQIPWKGKGQEIGSGMGS